MRPKTNYYYRCEDKEKKKQKTLNSSLKLKMNTRTVESIFECAVAFVIRHRLREQKKNATTQNHWRWLLVGWTQIEAIQKCCRWKRDVSAPTAMSNYSPNLDESKSMRFEREQRKPPDTGHDCCLVPTGGVSHSNIEDIGNYSNWMGSQWSSACMKYGCDLANEQQYLTHHTPTRSRTFVWFRFISIHRRIVSIVCSACAVHTKHETKWQSGQWLAIVCLILFHRSVFSSRTAHIGSATHRECNKILTLVCRKTCPIGL